MNEYKLSVIIEAVAEKFDSTIDKVSESLDRVQTKCQNASAKIEAIGTKVENAGKKMQTAGKYMTAFGAGAVVMGKKFVDAASESEQSQTKLTEVMRAMMGATDDEVDSINRLIDAEAKSGVVGKTVQRNGAQQLATYLHNKDALDTLIPAMNDLVVQQKGVNATSGDSINIANMMGKVFSGQVGALRRAGISFNEYQEHVLKTGTEMEKAAMLAEVINQNVGNMNQTMAETDAGRIAKAKMELQAVGTTIGSAILPAIADVAKFASEKMIPKLQEMANWFKSNPIAAKISLGLAAISAVGGPVLVILGKITANVGKMIKGLSKGTGLLSKVLTLPPQALAIVAVVGAIIAAFVHLYKTNDEFRAKMQATWAELKEAMAPAIDALRQAWEKMKPAIDTIIQAISSLLSVALPVIAQIVSVVVQAIAKVLPVIANIVAFVAEVLAAIFSAVSKVVQKISSIIQTIAKVVETIASIIRGIFIVLGDFISGIWQKVKDQAVQKWEAIKAKAQEIKDRIKAIYESLPAPVKAVFEKIATAVSNCFGRVEKAFNSLKKFATSIATGVSNAFSNMVSSVKKKINGFISAANVGIGVINKLPGVSVSKIPYLAHGTKDFAGGFAYMNEGGRGELTMLPNGSQVIPHDVSMKYAKESARYNNSGTDMGALMTATTNAIMTGMRMQNNNGGEYHLSIELGGKQIAETIYTLNKRGELIMKGV